MPHSFTEQIRKNHERFLETLKKIRAGRAHPEMVSDIPVEAYGAATPLSGLASISVSDARSLVIEPWDKQILKAIEKAVIGSGRNLSCAVDGAVVRASVPAMTEESRARIAASISGELERARIAARRAREEEKKRIELSERSGESTEDDRRKGIRELDDATREAVEALEREAEKKEAEIRHV